MVIVVRINVAKNNFGSIEESIFGLDVKEAFILFLI